MAEKVLLVADPGIDAALAIALAMTDPTLEVLALAATGGNVSPELATRNAYVIVEQIDPKRWPRIGTALPVNYDRDARDLHGPDGLGGQNFPCAPPHHSIPSDKLIVDTLRQHPNEITILVLGPATALARAIDRDPDVVRLIQRLVIVGGSWNEPGDVGPVNEFHFWCDPISARQVLRCGAPVTLLPLDVTRKMIFSPNDVSQLGALENRSAAFLKQIVPTLLAPTAGSYGIEGAYVADALAVAFVSQPSAFTLKNMAVDVETRGELTRGMTVFDVRWSSPARPNLDVVLSFELAAIRNYVHQVLAEGSA